MLETGLAGFEFDGQSSDPVLISIVIPAFNEEKLLPRTLAAIAKARTAFEPLGWSSEVIVCDNNSSDQTAAVARNAGATVVFEPRRRVSSSSMRRCLRPDPLGRKRENHCQSSFFGRVCFC